MTRELALPCGGGLPWRVMLGTIAVAVFAESELWSLQGANKIGIERTKSTCALLSTREVAHLQMKSASITWMEAPHDYRLFATL
jgi:hypothetical protein